MTRYVYFGLGAFGKRKRFNVMTNTKRYLFPEVHHKPKRRRHHKLTVESGRKRQQMLTPNRGGPGSSTAFQNNEDYNGPGGMLLNDNVSFYFCPFIIVYYIAEVSRFIKKYYLNLRNMF